MAKAVRKAPRKAAPPEIIFRKRDASLTVRERAVLQLFARGKTYQEIGEELELSSKTVGSYLQRVREKIRAKTRSDLITYAMQEGLLKTKAK